MGVLVRGEGEGRGVLLARWLEYRKDGNNKAGISKPYPPPPPPLLPGR
jgi:hypothetical protein